jgi:hypothetical protein
MQESVHISNTEKGLGFAAIVGVSVAAVVVIVTPFVEWVRMTEERRKRREERDRGV